MKVEEIIKHPLINHSCLAELLYGSREIKNRAKLSKKVNGHQKFKPWEIEKLNEIFTNLKKDWFNN